jgi:hypothetical protein
VEVNLYAATAGGDPTGAIIASKYNLMTSNPSGWGTFTLTNTFVVSAGTNYALRIRAFSQNMHPANAALATCSSVTAPAGSGALTYLNFRSTTNAGTTW